MPLNSFYLGLYLDLLFVHLKSDPKLLTHGWVSMLEGFSIFVNSEMEETLDDALTLLSGDKSLMQIEIRQENRKLMGEPFTACFDPNL